MKPREGDGNVEKDNGWVGGGPSGGIEGWGGLIEKDNGFISADGFPGAISQDGLPGA